MKTHLVDAMKQTHVSALHTSRHPQVQGPSPRESSDCSTSASRRYRSLLMRAETSGNGASSEAAAFIRPHLRKLAPYSPIEPFEILSKRYELKRMALHCLTLSSPLCLSIGNFPSDVYSIQYKVILKRGISICLSWPTQYIQALFPHSLPFLSQRLLVNPLHPQGDCREASSSLRKQSSISFHMLLYRLGRSPDQIIKLDANENPYGPPPEVREALASMPYPNIYPDPETRRLRAALAAENDISLENLLVGLFSHRCTAL